MQLMKQDNGHSISCLITQGYKNRDPLHLSKKDAKTLKIIQPKNSVVEHTLSWLNNYRRLAKF